MAGNGVNVGHGNISISPVLVPGFAGILQAQLSHLRPQPTIQVGVNVDRSGLRGLNQQINGASGGGVRLRTVLAGAVAVVSAKALKDKYDGLYGLQNRFVGITAAASAAGSVLGPLLGLVGGLGTGLAVAGVGIGAFAALAAPQIKTVTTATAAASKAQDDYNTAIATGDTAGAQKALQDRQKALATLTPAQRAATEATLNLKTAFKAQSDALAPVTLGLYTKGVQTLTGLLPALTPVARAAGSALQGVFARAQAGLGQALSPDGGLGAFLNTVREQVGPAIDQLALIFVHLGSTISFVFQRAVPVMQPALAVLEHLTGSLANAAGGQGLINFFAQVKPLLAPLEQALRSIVSALGAFIQATVPLAGPVLGALRAAGDALKQLFNSAPFQAFVQNVGSAITSLTPLFAALVGPLGNVLQVISGQFAALAPVLVPLITNFANVFSQVLVGLSPLLPLFVQLANILVGFLPVLYPIITALRDALAPILQAVGQALIAIMPAVQQVVQAFVPLAPLLGQLFAALVPLIAQLVSAFAPVLAAILQAMQPLIPVITQVVTQLGGAFVQALAILLPALIPLIPPLGQLVTALLQLALAVLQPLLPVLPLIARLFAAFVPVLIPLVNAFTWLVNTLRPLAPLLLLIIFPFAAIVLAVEGLVRVFTWAWNTIIFPIVRAAAPLFIWLYQNAILPAFNGIKVALGAVGAAFSWAWNVIIHPVLSAFATVARALATVLVAFVFAPIKLAWLFLSNEFKLLWNTILHPVFSAVASVARGLWNNVLKPIFAGISWAWGVMSRAMKSVWESSLHPMLHAVSQVIGGVKNAFGAAVDGIKSIWNGLKRIFAAPINAVIFPVVEWVSKGVDAVTNFAGLGKPMQGMEKLPRFATGGVIPGNHNRDTVPFYGTPGEVVVPKPVVNSFGGPDALMSTLGFNGSGGSAGAHLFGGGPIKSLSHAVSTVVGGAGNVVKKVGGAIFNGADWAFDGIVGALRAGAADAFDGAYKLFSGPLFGLLGKGQVPDMLHGTVNKMESQLIAAIRGKEVADVGLGSENISWDGGSNTIGLIIRLARQLGSKVPVSSTNTGGHASGSYHYRNEAVDFSDGTDTPGEFQLASAFAQHYGGSLAELFHHPLGFSIKDGQRVSWIPSNHDNHVHVAISPSSISRGHQSFMPFGSGATGPAGEGSIVQQVHAAAAARGWGGQLGALDYIIGHESSWNPNAQNPGSTAHGLFQLLYGGGGSVAQQIQAGFGYIAGRYGNPANAQRFWASHHWYDNGGYLMPGATAAFNGTNRPEPVFTAAQWKILAGNLKAGVSSGGGPLIGTAYIREEADADLVAARIDFKSKVGSL